ncbi:MAG: class I SAM-dependent methyltransferase [Frankia sp.]|nr:class I SAM-dependent methyltransferase [Frankia sp.]
MLTPSGAELLERAAAALAEGDELRAGERLRAAGVAPGLVAAAFTQAELRRRAASWFARADEMLFTRAGLEQSTAEAVARHRSARFASLVDGGRLADLCTGIGGDLLALAGIGRPLLAVDRDPVHLRIAVHNCRVYVPDAQVEACLADVREVDLAGVAGVFVDPARRSDGRRLAAGVSEPPLAWCLELAERVPAVAVKAAPGLPTGLVPAGWEVEFVAVGRDLKEAVLCSPALAAGTSRRATVLLAGPPAAPEVNVATLCGEPDPPAADGGRVVGEPGAYLFDPSPAVTRAGLVGELARRLGAWQVDPLIAFLTADRAVRTPFARPLRIEASLPFDTRRVAAVLRGMGISALDLRRRGLAGDVETLRRRLLPARRDLVPGGPAVTVVMTRYRDRPWAFVCVDVPDGADEPDSADQG